MWYVNWSIMFLGYGATFSFILTMWYVNGDSGSFTYTWRAGFILTMWYVNFRILSSCAYIV